MIEMNLLRPRTASPDRQESGGHSQPLSAVGMVLLILVSVVAIVVLPRMIITRRAAAPEQEQRSYSITVDTLADGTRCAVITHGPNISMDCDW